MEQIGLDWTWKERFPRQTEVEQYLNKMADFLDLKKDIQFSTRVTASKRDEANNTWVTTTDSGEQFTSRFLVGATGPLATPLDPPFPGLATYKGEWYRTGLWPKEPVDFAGKRVAVIGTGATGIQVIPLVAHLAKHVTVFQRTPNYVMPARNHPLSEEQWGEISRDYPEIMKRAKGQTFGFDITDKQTLYSAYKDDPAAVQRILERGWEKGGFRFIFETFSDILVDTECNEAVSEFVRQRIRSVIDDPETAEMLCPRYPIFSKRPPAGHFYYEAFNRPNVKLVDIKKDPILDVTPNGLKTGSQEYEFDMIIFAIGKLCTTWKIEQAEDPMLTNVAIGFDAVTGTLGKIDIRGSQDQHLGTVLGTKMKTNLGLTVPGFPNFAMIFGPQSPFANGPMVIDVMVDWIGRTMGRMKAQGHNRIESTEEGAEKWADHVNMVLNALVIAETSKQESSWMVGSNVEGKTQGSLMYLGGVPAFSAAVAKEIDDNYPGHQFSTQPSGVTA